MHNWHKMCYFVGSFYVMKKFFTPIFLLFSFIVFSQNEQLAQNYFDRGEFEKAMLSYEELLKAQPNNSIFFQKLVDCYQQLQQFEKAEKNIQERLEKFKQTYLIIELGYNFQLQKQTDKAKKFYDEAIERIKKNPTEVYNVGYTFERKAIIDYAILAYETGISLDPKLNFNYQLAMLYGQKGDTDTMIEKFLTESFNNPQSITMIQSQLSRFMTEDATLNFNEALKKALLIRVQKTQDIFWNQYLSWYYVQLKEYGKAFIQEKAIYKRNPESFTNIVNLAQLAISEADEASATEILSFVLENTNDEYLKIQAHTYLLELKIKKSQPKDYPTITSMFDELVKQFGIKPNSLDLILLQAHFVAFNLKKPEDAKNTLKELIALNLNREQLAKAKMELADIMLLEEKFNQALLYYSQIETDANNSPIGQEASLKIAKTSYYQSDFNWANQQLKVLKSASSQLIANDALDLFLLISDNTVEDSTQVALKKFARADFLLFQDKQQEALEGFKKILLENKGDNIEAVTYLRIGKIYDKMANFSEAITNYNQIIQNHKDCIYVDEATFFSAEIYNQLGDFEKAKPLYEAIIMNHEDSIYFVQSQKRYRQLRGDKEL